MEESQTRWPLLALVTAALLAGLVGGVVGGLVAGLGFGNGDEADSEPAAGQMQTLVEGADLREAVARVIPAVVTVVNQVRPRPDVGGQVVQETAVGSGVIVDELGYIVTNEHVVRDAASLTVFLHDGRELPATLVGDDSPFTDVAVIQVEPGAEGLQAVPFGDSDQLALGEPVAAVGTALQEFESTVTVGVVSGLHRRWHREGVVMEDLVQTDAAVNHGNSGGALLNRRGELVGLNTTVVRSTEEGQVVEGVAFALSSNAIAPIVRAIIEEQRFPRAFLGISHHDLTEEEALLSGLPVDRGALVLAVSPGTPAEEAGLRVGDIILSMGDQELNEDMPFLNALGRLRPGETVDVVVYRDGGEVRLAVTPALR